MALVQLSDVIVPEFFAEYMALNSMTSTALFQSGVLVPNALMLAQIQMGGDILNIPAWTDLVSVADPGGSDPNLSNDNPAQSSTPNLINAVNQVVRKSRSYRLHLLPEKRAWQADEQSVAHHA
ncbi:MAG: hypothetical protein WBD32_12900, partial [Acidobacteriaceae bacterium]